MTTEHNKEILEDLLIPYKNKANESNENLAILGTDKVAMFTKIIYSWQYLRHNWVPPEEQIPEDPSEQLDWLWQGSLPNLDLEILEPVMDMSNKKMLDVVLLLGRMLLIFPDGTVAPHVKEFITQVATIRDDK